MTRNVNSSDPDEIFKMNSLEAFKGNGEKVKIRFYIPNERNIINSGLLYTILKSHYPEIDSQKNLFQTFIQAHRFNIGQFGESERKDNLLKKNEGKFDPEFLNPYNLNRIGMEEDYFGRKIFSNENIESLFKLFRPERKENIIIDEILYQALPDFFISKKGYIKYLVKVFNSVYNLWLEKNIRSFNELKTRIIDVDILEKDEKEAYLKIKQNFKTLLNITDRIYTINKSQTLVIEKSQLDKIKSDIETQIRKSLKGLRKGNKKQFYKNLLFLLQDFDKKNTYDKVEILIEIFDEFYDSRVLYIHLSRRLEKFYCMIIGDFCRIILHSLVEQEKLSREEIRLFILMNIPLSIFNYNKTNEPLIQQFISYHNYRDKLFQLMIFRKRTFQDLKDFHLIFKSYLKTYFAVIMLRRDYDQERKRKVRSREDNVENGTEISTIDYESANIKMLAKSKKKPKEDSNEIKLASNSKESGGKLENDFAENSFGRNDNEDETPNEMGELNENDDLYSEANEYEDSVLKHDGGQDKLAIETGKMERFVELDNEDSQDEEDSLSTKKSSKKISNSNKREYSIRNVELNDFLSYYKFDKIDIDIIYFKMEKCSFDQIGELLTPAMSKQAVSKRWSKIMAILPPGKELYQKIMDY